jgi:hypothetical protein
MIDLCRKYGYCTDLMAMFNCRSNNKGGFQMKKLTVFAVAAVLVFIFSSSSHAYTIFISNNTDTVALVEVEGEHLFWRQIDCKVTVNPQSDGQCEMPGGICPVYTYITLTNNHHLLYYNNGVPTYGTYTYDKVSTCGLYCGNRTIVLSQRGSDKQVYIRCTY